MARWRWSITATERAARHAPAPVLIAAAAGAGLFEEEIASNHYRPDLAVMDGSRASAERLFDASGIIARRHRRGHDLRRVLADLLMQLEAWGSAAPAKPRTSSPMEISASMAACPATPTGG